MEKNLRSLIHEKFPLELRVQIDLLSRRRDIRNKEKQEELLKLLQANNIEGVVPLGPGTNRYAFKLDGFVVKVATDNDGKIDNLKEFKMAKRLYPHVTKVYEVSENGTLLVAQYIQPFDSYAEMCKYADEIRKILTELSSVYLIGDVGITSTNYSNWGLPIGSDKPVCLDFAYVYEVSSELFICRHCKANAMLAPNKDFTELYCSNPACGKRYLFEDIRARIGNDLHRHEIGDLKEEGYALLKSNTKTELSEQRSNYLIRKREKVNNEPKTEQQEDVVYDSFEMDHSPKYYINKEENVMSDILTNAKAIAATMDDGDMSDKKVIIIKAKSVEINDNGNNGSSPVVKKDDLPVVKATVVVPSAQNEESIQSTTGVVFSGKIEDVGTPTYMQGNSKTEEMVITERIEEPVIHGTIVSSAEHETSSNHLVEEKPTEDVDDSEEVVAETEVQEEPVVMTTEVFPESFLKNAHKAVSILSNVIANELHARAVFDEVKGNISDKKMYPETFYKCVQNVIFRSLMVFLNFSEVDEPNTNNNGTHKIFIAPKEIYGTEYEPTMTFIARLWTEHLLKDVEEPEAVLSKYYSLYGNTALTIQPKWLYTFKDRIRSKMRINNNGINKLADLIEEVWCVVVDEEPEVDDSVEEDVIVDETVADDSEEVVAEAEVQEETAECSKEDDEASMHVHEEIEAVEAVTEENIADSFAGSYTMNQEAEVEEFDSEESEEDPNDEEYQDRKYLSVDIFYEDDIDVIKVNTEDAFGPISIPLYAKIEEISLESPEPTSLVDDRNGKWDWLIHMVPDLMFTTKDPDKYLEINDEDFGDEYNNIKVVIIDETNGEYTMAIHYIEGIYVVDEEGQRHLVDDENILRKINRVVKENIAYGNISHLARSLTMKQLIYDESYIQLAIDEAEGESDGESEDVVDPVAVENENISDAEQAAVDAMLGITNNTQVADETVADDSEEVVVEPEAQEEKKCYNYDPPKIAVQVADRYLGIIGNDEGYEYTIYDEEYNEVDGGMYDNKNVSIKELLDILLIEIKSSPNPIVKGSTTNTSGHQVINYNDLTLKAAIKKERDAKSQYVDEESAIEEAVADGESSDEAPAENDGILHPIRRKHQ